MNTLPDKRDHPERQTQNIQDGFLNTARKEKLHVTVYLLSGVKLTGRIRSFDRYSVVLESGNQEQLIFKHAISTVVLPRGGAMAATAASSTSASAPSTSTPAGASASEG